MKKILAILIISGLLVGAVYFIKNTSIDEDISKEEKSDQISLNNFNTVPEEKEDVFTELFTQEIAVNGTVRELNLPEDFEISVAAEGLKRPRFMEIDENDNLIVADIEAGQIILIKKDGSKITVDEGLRNINSVDLYEGDLYAAEEDKVSVYREFSEDGSYESKETLISNLPTDGGHYTRTVNISPDGKLFLSIGSSCNVCEEQDERRAAIVEYNLKGEQIGVYAQGLRNTVGFVFKDKNTGGEYEIWGVDHGRDNIGDDLPVEEVNIIEKGAHYGWPYCHGDGIPNPEFPDKRDFCANETEFPAFSMQAHSAPLGLRFSSPNFHPDLSENDLFIGFHGSWNRSVPTGYKIVRIDTSDNTNSTNNFVTGWLTDDGNAWGRPVDVIFNSEGAMYISDDRAGVIYKVVYTGK